jgi:hypothetical protein
MHKHVDSLDGFLTINVAKGKICTYDLMLDKLVDTWQFDRMNQLVADSLTRLGVRNTRGLDVHGVAVAYHRRHKERVALHCPP